MIASGAASCPINTWATGESLTPESTGEQNGATLLLGNPA